jgi:hypothetical protein
VRGARIEHGTRPFHGSDPAPDATRPARTRVADEGVVGAAPDGRVEVDQLQLPEPREGVDPLVEVVVFESQPFALHELDDAVVLQVDGRDEHGWSDG